MFLYRAINKEELKEFLTLNKLELKWEIKKRTKYSFIVHKETRWVNREGNHRWHVYAMARDGGDYCGIVLRFWSWGSPSLFEENKGQSDRGKFYCLKDHKRTVKVDYLSLD
ncbi:hypothetical protein HYW21_03345 [Candidatus Woesearchaeota archaeon]|nr:hypothetical protein [Candidatus Woesearchaeota archaeon]